MQGIDGRSTSMGFLFYRCFVNSMHNPLFLSFLLLKSVRFNFMFFHNAFFFYIMYYGDDKIYIKITCYYYVFCMSIGHLNNGLPDSVSFLVSKKNNGILVT